ncbi:hypothetical protein ANANG_G00224930 [Anguilla anguilla]|uniref:Uncharacterized protein n=1 Tax=Anguilla anguilla TaxID=7936 RepID=A0A9D3RQ21_ANGAN|nr:hypothetical protein ANANG_G00224930 [Anguilla anguilla]
MPHKQNMAVRKCEADNERCFVVVTRAPLLLTEGNCRYPPCHSLSNHPSPAPPLRLNPQPPPPVRQPASANTAGSPGSFRRASWDGERGLGGAEQW